MNDMIHSIIGTRKLAFGGAVFAGLMRIVPHPPNFTPAGGLAIYSGARLSGWRAFATPLVMMVVSGLILSWMHGYSFWSSITAVVLLSFGVYVLFGKLLRNTENPLAIGGVTIAGSVQFFLITNFAVWALAGYYPPTAAGLLACYVAAIPFFGAPLLGDLFYSAALFTAHHFLARSFFPDEVVPAAAA